MDRIPKGRDFTAVVTTAPGANAESNAGGTQIDGSSDGDGLLKDKIRSLVQQGTRRIALDLGFGSSI